MKYISAFTTQNWEVPPGDSYEIADKILEMNGISIKDAAFSVSSDCSDFLKKCYWGQTEFGCLDTSSSNYLKFSLSTTYLGPCCSFNSNSMNSSFAPFSTNSFGLNSGLTIIGSEGRFSNLSSGLIILIHHPLDYPTESVKTVTVKTSSETFLEINPGSYSTSKEILDLTPDKRNCFTSSDLEVNFYRASLCTLNCQNEAIFKQCGCYPYQMQNSLNRVVKECKLKDVFCYTENFGALFYSFMYFIIIKLWISENFKNAKCNDCFPNCNDVSYDSATYNIDLVASHFSVHPL